MRARVVFVVYRVFSAMRRAAHARDDFFQAVSISDVASVEVFLNDGLVAPDVRDAHGRTCLHVAAASADSDMLTLLISRPEIDSDLLDSRDRDGNTPLHAAVAAPCSSAADVNGRVACVRALLESAVQVSSGHAPVVSSYSDVCAAWLDCSPVCELTSWCVLRGT